MLVLTLSANTQVNDCVIGPGSPKYDNAYWEVSYIRTFIAADSQPGAPSNGTSPTNTGTGSSSTGAPSYSGATDSMVRWHGLSVGVSVTAVLIFTGLIPVLA